MGFAWICLVQNSIMIFQEGTKTGLIGKPKGVTPKLEVLGLGRDIVCFMLISNLISDLMTDLISDFGIASMLNS
jgi:hypothetical protein